MFLSLSAWFVTEMFKACLREDTAEEHDYRLAQFVGEWNHSMFTMTSLSCIIIQKLETMMLFRVSVLRNDVYEKQIGSSVTGRRFRKTQNLYKHPVCNRFQCILTTSTLTIGILSSTVGTERFWRIRF